MTDSTIGVVLLGTPSSGSLREQWAAIVQGVQDVTEESLYAVDQLAKRANPNLIELRNQFNHLLEAREQARKPIGLRRFVAIQTFLEAVEVSHLESCITCQLKSFLQNVPLAPPSIADYDEIGILSDHRNMVKFSGRNDSGYLRMIGCLLRWLNVDESRRQLQGPPAPGPQFPEPWQLPDNSLGLETYQPASYDQSYRFGRVRYTRSYNQGLPEFGASPWQGSSFDTTPMVRTTVRGDEASEVSIDIDWGSYNR